LRVEHPDLRPVLAILLDEGMVPWGVLVGVVGGLGLEDKMERDVELAVSDRPVELGLARAAGEEYGARVRGQGLLAGRAALRNGGGGILLQVEVAIVSQHRRIASQYLSRQ